MYPSNLYAELRSGRRARLQQKAIMIVVAAIAGYLLGLMTVLYIITSMQ